VVGARVGVTPGEKEEVLLCSRANETRNVAITSVRMAARTIKKNALLLDSGGWAS